MNSRRLRDSQSKAQSISIVMRTKESLLRRAYICDVGLLLGSHTPNTTSVFVPGVGPMRLPRPGTVVPLAPPQGRACVFTIPR